MTVSPVFEETYNRYLDEIRKLDLEPIAEKLGFSKDGNRFRMPLYHEIYYLSDEGIRNEKGKIPPLHVSVIFLKHLILAEKITPYLKEDTPWCSFRDFKDAAPFIGAFNNYTEKAIAANFEKRPDALKKAALLMGANESLEPVSYDLKLEFKALPKMPLLLLFNDRDDTFPAECVVLFRKTAEIYLDMECLAMVGMYLEGCLKYMDA